MRREDKYHNYRGTSYESAGIKHNLLLGYIRVIFILDYIKRIFASENWCVLGYKYIKSQFFFENKNKKEAR